MTGRQPLSDDALLEAARDGDLEATETLLIRHGREVRARLSINPKWRSVLDADDVMQITYVEAFLEIRAFRGNIASFPAWLTRIATNNLRDAITGLERDKRPHPDRCVGGVDALERLYGMLTGAGTTPTRMLAREDMRRSIDAAMEQLPPDYAEVIRLCDLHGGAVGDVATRLNRTYGAVYLLRQRALERLGREIGTPSRFMTG